MKYIVRITIQHSQTFLAVYPILFLLFYLSYRHKEHSDHPQNYNVEYSFFNLEITLKVLIKNLCNERAALIKIGKNCGH